MLGDYLTAMAFILAILGMVGIILRNVIPGVLNAFIIILKLLLNLALIPINLVVGILKFLFKRRGKIIGAIKYTTTVSEKYVDRKGNVRTHTDSVETTVPCKRKGTNIFNKSGRF